MSTPQENKSTTQDDQGSTQPKATAGVKAQAASKGIYEPKYAG